MHVRSLCLLLLVTSPFVSVSASAQSNPCNNISQGQEGSLNGFVPFPSSSLWNTNISNAAVDPNSSAIINFIGSSTPVHADFGAGLYNGQTIGIPYIVVPGNQPNVTVNYTAYGDESDPGPMLVPLNAQIEGYPSPGDGDRHVSVLDKGNCWLYELYGAYKINAGLWMLRRVLSGTWKRMNSGRTPGPRQMPRGCQFFPGWFATTRLPADTSITPSA